MDPRELPVWQLHFDLLRGLRHGNALVLVAATGSGKTTQVPQMLLDGGIAGDRRIVILQPRRVAARTVAARVAWERGQPLGGEVGYQVRFEDHLSRDSRLCFVTEGILLRWMQEDPELRDVGVLIFDEFHERNLLSDVALALAKRLQQTTRPDLKLVVMSATLETEPVARYLTARPDSPEPPCAPVLSSEGRAYPVEIRWAEYGDERPAPEQAADAVERIVQSGAEGDILVFMPGMGEILSTLNALRAARLPEPCVFLPLHGDLPPEEQDRAFQSFERRKIVVATNVAETSVTIDGIRHVVDSGIARVARYDAARGIQTLAIEPISRASADQRAGRAGRTAPGTCWRLWTESAQLDRPERNTPEIRRSDLAEVVLLLHSLGIRHAAAFDWLDRPDPAAVARAERLLITLGALEPPAAAPGSAADAPAPRTSDLTPVGRQMLRLPMHPRYARMLVEASKHGCVPAAALCAALTSGRDLLVRPGRDDAHLKEARELFEGSRDSDFHTLLRAHQYARNCQFDPGACRRMGIHAQTARQVEDTFRQLMGIAERERLVSRDPAPEPPAAGPATRPAAAVDPLPHCIAAGFMDQLAVRKDTGSLDCRLAEGRTATLARESVVDSELLVAAALREVDGRHGRTTLITLATAVRPEWLEQLYPQHVNQRQVCEVDRLHKRVAALRETRFLDLVVRRDHCRDVDPDAAGRALADAFAAGWFELPKLDHGVRQFVARVQLLSRIAPELEIPPLDGAGIRHALTRAFRGLTLIKDAQATDLREAFGAHLDPAQRGFLDELLPTSIPGPGDKPLRLQYTESAEATEEETPEGPEGLVRLTEAFALKLHPLLAEGRLPVRLVLQSPDQKRLAVTTDFPSWRQKSYPTLRAPLRAKFPGFPWP
ncbi:MAG: ATP-dependent RNA helicase [Verrucomicrobia bacterium]|nr:ATP-dependent RNA helicase [Verrucomicrobiota bacterium]